VKVRLALSVALSCSPIAASETPAEAVRLLHRVEARHRAVSDFTARFVQTYRSGALGREVVEKGHVSIKPPGRMLWEYTDPEKKLFVADGRRFFLFVPADRQVIVKEQAGDKSAPSLLLSGRGSILDQFEAAIEPAPLGRSRLRLTPRTPDPEMQQVFLEIDAQDRIRGIDVIDAQGAMSRVRLEELRENVGLRDSLFRFTPPPGVEVIQG
jgi:outer membrane lipoprotein carrier protein